MFGLCLPEYSTAYCNIVNYYINAKLVDVGSQYLLPKVLTLDVTTVVSQYEFKIEYLTISPKHVKLPSQEEDLKGIAGLGDIEKPF